MNWKDYQTDKENLHRYQEHYDKHLGSIREDVTSVLEIGIQYGHSIALWLDYFPNAMIYAVDIDPKAVEAAQTQYGTNPRVAFGQVDASEAANLSGWAYDMKIESFDVVIDDGSHRMRDQEQALLFGSHWSNYFTVIEDLHTSQMNSRQYGIETDKDTFLDLCTKWPDLTSIEPVSLSRTDLEWCFDNFRKLHLEKGRVSEIAFFERDRSTVKKEYISSPFEEE